MATIIKSIIATILYIVIMELSAVWLLAPFYLEIDYAKYYRLIQGTIQLLVVIIFIQLIRNKPLKENWKPVKTFWYYAPVIIGCSFVFFQSPLNWIYNSIFDAEYYFDYGFDGLIELKNINIFSTIFFVPIAEELFFRGYIQKELQKKTHIWAAIIIASSLFALIHAQFIDSILSDSPLDWHLCYITFFGGLISGIIYFKSGSILPSIIFHACWNLMALIV